MVDPENFHARYESRILIVDDDPDCRLLITTLIERFGGEATAVSDSSFALEAYRTHSVERPFDLILLDIRMPLLNGNHLAAQVRANGYQGMLAALTATEGGQEQNEKNVFDHYVLKQHLSAESLKALLRKAGKNKAYSQKPG
jgi:hypothetical protein